jgi:hypothetical protein
MMMRSVALLGTLTTQGAWVLYGSTRPTVLALVALWMGNRARAAPRQLQTLDPEKPLTVPMEAVAGVTGSERFAACQSVATLTPLSYNGRRSYPGMTCGRIRYA